MLIQHTYPENDPTPHVVHLTESCWCIPAVQDEANGFTVIHRPSIPLVSTMQEEELSVPDALRSHPAYAGQLTMKRLVKVSNLRIVTVVLKGALATTPTSSGHAH